MENEKLFNVSGEFRYYNDKSIDITLNPEDYKDCNTLDYLKFNIENDLRKALNINHDTVIRSNIKISDEFIKEWKALVGFIPGNVMTYKMRDAAIFRDDVYTKVMSGASIKYQARSYSGGDAFHLNNYPMSFFDDKKDYKCWLLDSDYSFYWTQTSLLYAEEV